MINMFIGNFLLLINLTVFSKQMLSVKFNNKAILPIFIIIGVIILSSRSYPNLQLIGTLLMVSYYIFFINFLFKGEISKKLLTFILFLSIATISEVLSANIMNLLFGLNQDNINTFLYTIALLLSSGITFILLNIMNKFVKIYTKYKLPENIWLIFILPLTTIFLLVNLNDYFETFRSNILTIPIILGLLAANFITIYIFFQSIKNIQLENEIKEIQAKYDTINILYQNNFDFLHDTIWKLNHIYKKISDNQLLKDIDELCNDLLKKYNIINTNSSIISSILNYRLNEIVENNIQIRTDLSYSNFSFLESKVQIELFSILINNAIDSCLSVNNTETNIIMSSKKINGQIFIRCHYSFSSYYKDKNDYQINKINQIVTQQNGIFSSTYYEESSELLISFNKSNSRL